MAKQAFVANDRTIFDTEAEADAHNAALEKAAVVADYVKAANLDGAAAKTVAKHLAQFLVFQDGGEITPEPTKERKPRAKKVGAAPAA